MPSDDLPGPSGPTSTARPVPDPAAPPELSVSDPAGSVRAVALVLHGGRVASTAATADLQLAVLRMVPIAWALHYAGRDRGLAVWRLRFRVRGWNGEQASPVEDARWALAEIRRRHGAVPVVLVGHSMGGRTALRVGGDDGVVGIAALAPWLPPGEPYRQLAGRDLLILHGTRDRITSAPDSRTFGERAASVGARVRRVDVVGDGHAMLRRSRVWNRVTSDYVLQRVTSPSEGSAAAKDGRAGENPLTLRI